MLHFDETLVAAIAFLVFAGVILYLKVPATIAKSLDEQSLAIAKELEQAKQLRLQAEELRQSYEKQQADAVAQAKAMIEQAEEDAKALKKAAKEQLKADIAAKTKAASERIARAEINAIDEVRAFAAQRAIDVAANMFKIEASGKGGEKIFADSLKKVSSSLSKAS